MWVSPGRSSCASVNDDPGPWIKCTDYARSYLCSIEENVQVPVEIRKGRCRAASRVSVPDTFLTLRRFSLHIWIWAISTYRLCCFARRVGGDDSRFLVAPLIVIAL